MRILHVGQLGIGAWPHTAPSLQERRVEMLAREAAQRGHKVAIVGTAPYASPRLNHAYGITLVRRPSLNPQQPGGWFYALTSLWTLWRQQPDVIHLHGWRVGALAWLAALASPESQLVWTIDALSATTPLWQRLIVWQAAHVCDTVATPSRTVQYILRSIFEVPSRYIPDGYTPSSLAPLPLKQFGARAGHYHLVLGSSEKALKRVLTQYGKVRSQKKLVLVATNSNAAKYLVREPRTVVMDNLFGRQLDALVRGAATVILADSTTSSETLLTAMAHGRVVFAPNDPRYQEILGITGRYFRVTRPQELAALWQELNKKSFPRRSLGAQAHIRASRHFTWARVTQDYLTAYAARARATTVDSAVPLPATHRLSATTK